jgi:hypothetical protein
MSRYIHTFHTTLFSVLCYLLRREFSWTR